MLRMMCCAALTLVLVGNNARGQDFMIEHEEQQGLRGFHGSRSSQIRRSFASDSDARAELDRILTSIGLNWIGDRVILRASGDIPNAEAGFEKKTNKRYIFYNATFMQQVKQRTAEHWSLVSILAHELGHHLAYHTEIPGNYHKFELEADYFSGFVVRRLGATLDQSLVAMKLIGDKEASVVYPRLDDRLQAITLGWTDAGFAGAPRGLKATLAAQGETRQDPIASDRLCVEERQAKSMEGTVNATLTFQNRGVASVKIYWINYAGNREFYAAIAPGQSLVQQTYVTHPWIIADENEQCLGFYLPEQGNRDVVIR